MSTTPLNERHLIRLAQTSKATDPRDKVYGMPGLLRNPLSARIKPDYSPHVQWEHVYMLFSSALVEEMGKLNLLATIDGYKPGWAFQPDGPGIPSWVVDLGKAPHGIYGSTMNGILFSDRNFDADRGLKPSITFSDDGRTLICKGLVVDTIDGLDRGDEIIRWRLAESDPQSLHPEIDHMVKPSRAQSNSSNSADSKLSIARALLHDADYQFSSGPSPLDLPWYTADEISIYRRLDYTDSDLVLELEDPRAFADLPPQPFPWISGSKNPLASSVSGLFDMVLHPNEDFELGGTPRRDYFTASAERLCSDPGAYFNMLAGILPYFSIRRLFATESGRIGTVPLHSMPGDKIVIVLGCQMPLVLRKHGGCYELVGGCFVDGLMKGEAVEEVWNGRAGTERIRIC